MDGIEENPILQDELLIVLHKIRCENILLKTTFYLYFVDSLSAFGFGSKHV